MNWYDYGFRNYDPQIGRFMQLDPLTDSYPFLTPYQYASCDPIDNIDIDGLEGGLSTTANKAITLEAVIVKSAPQWKTLNAVVVTASRVTPKVATIANNTAKLMKVLDLTITALKTVSETLQAGLKHKSILTTASTNHISCHNPGLRPWDGGSEWQKGGIHETSDDGQSFDGSPGEIDDGDGDPVNIDGIVASAEGIVGAAEHASYVSKDLKEKIEVIRDLTKEIVEEYESYKREHPKSMMEKPLTTTPIKYDAPKPPSVTNTPDNSPKVEPIKNTIKPVTQSPGRIRHGYTLKTGVFKDTTINTLDSNGNIIKSEAKTIIVPIKPVKERYK